MRRQIFSPCLAALAALVTASVAIAQPPVSVIAQEVAIELVSDPLEALGTLRANEAVNVTANVSDTVSRIHFEDGDSVQAGQVLVELTDSEEQAFLAEAQARLDEAQRQYLRLEKLVADGTAAESLLDERRREAQTAAAQLDAVRSRLADRLVTAPFTGSVGLRNISPGARLAPGDVITTLVDDSSMKLDFSIPSVYLPSVGKGTPIVAITPVYPGRTFKGEVISVDSTINPDTRAITVRARLPNSGRALVPGMLMAVDLSRAERDALVIAETAVVPKGSDAFVWVLSEPGAGAKAQLRQVRLGTRQPGKVEVLEGLSAGELVVTHGVQKLRPGAAVALRAIETGEEQISELIRGGAAPAGDD